MTRSRWTAFAALLALLVCSVATAQSGNSAGERIKPGKWRIGDEPKGWILDRTDNYQVQSQIPRERARIVANHLEAMMREYRRRFPTGKSLQDFVLKIFSTGRNYHDYGGPPNSLAYFNEHDNELVCYDTGMLTGKDAPPPPEEGRDLNQRLKELGLIDADFQGEELRSALTKLSTMPLLGVLSHEGWHQYFHFWITSMVDFPSWLDEGMGDYFLTAVPSADGKKVACGGLNPGRFIVIYSAIRAGKHVPVKQLIRYRQQDYYKNPSLCYAEGWSLVYFCYHGGNQRYTEIPDRLIKIFKDKHKMDQATDAAFKGIDVDRFEEEWKAFYMNMDFAKTAIELARERTGGGESRGTTGGSPPPQQH